MLARLGSLFAPVAPAAAGTPRVHEARPDARIEDRGTVTSTLDVPEGLTGESLKLDLDLAHTYRGDLTHKVDSVDAAEVERNRRIAALQGNVNAFVEHSNLADRISDF